MATFTIGCYTVTLAGPARTFSETFRSDGTTRTVTVTHSTWVRAAPGPVDATIDERWLSCALAANQAGTPDALAIAMQYIKNAPPILLGDLQIAGDASYGPLLPDGTRDEGSDFNDYLGLRWLYPADDARQTRGCAASLSRLLRLHADGVGLPSPSAGRRLSRHHPALAPSAIQHDTPPPVIRDL